jgi:hypothetical protein
MSFALRLAALNAATNIAMCFFIYSVLLCRTDVATNTWSVKNGVFYQDGHPYKIIAVNDRQFAYQETSGSCKGTVFILYRISREKAPHVRAELCTRVEDFASTRPVVRHAKGNNSIVFVIKLSRTNPLSQIGLGDIPDLERAVAETVPLNLGHIADRTAVVGYNFNNDSRRSINKTAGRLQLIV